MKQFLLIVVAILTMAMVAMTVDWQTNFFRAKEEAQKEHKYLLLNFSRSDWCVQCIRTKKDILTRRNEAYSCSC
jgi:thioredoxin-related protein